MSVPTMSVPTLNEVLAEIRRVARDELSIELAIEPHHGLIADLALDSMSVTVLAVALEDRYRIVLREEDGGAITVGDLAALVVRRVEEARS